MVDMAGGSSNSNPQLIISHKFPETTNTYTERYKIEQALLDYMIKVCFKELHKNFNELWFLLCKAAILELEILSYEKESGELLCMNRMTLYLRGAGGFSKSSQLYSYSKYPLNKIVAPKIPNSRPFAIYEDCLQPSQALLYRLSGDNYALHVDPRVAESAGQGDH